MPISCDSAWFRESTHLLPVSRAALLLLHCVVTQPKVVFLERSMLLVMTTRAVLSGCRSSALLLAWVEYQHGAALRCPAAMPSVCRVGRAKRALQH